MKNNMHLAFDLGAESGRAIVGAIHNGQLTLEEIHRFPTKGMQVNGSLRWDIYRLFREIKTGITKYVAKYGNALGSIGIDTWGLDFGLLDKKGKLIGIPYHYRDNRNVGTEKILDDNFGNKRIYDLTGIQFMRLNTLNQVVSMIESHDPILKIAEGLMFIGDLLHYFLSGKICTEYTVASISQFYNNAKKDWSDEIFNAFNIPEALKTQVIEPGHIISKIRADLANELGLSEETLIVVPAVHDTASAAVAIPADGDDWAYISSGTWSIAGIETNSPIINDQSYKLNIANSGGVNGKNLFLKNIMGLWIVQQCKKIWNAQYPDLNYSQLMQLAQKAQPFRGYIDPDNQMFMNPTNAPDTINRYLQGTDQSTVDPQDMGTVIRIVLESLAYKYRYYFERIAMASKANINKIYVIGGGSQNSLLNQFTSNCMNKQVFAGPIEATAIGNIMMQAYGMKEISSLSEIREVVKNSFNIESYNPEDVKAWEHAYKGFLEKTKQEK